LVRREKLSIDIVVKSKSKARVELVGLFEKIQSNKAILSARKKVE